MSTDLAPAPTPTSTATPPKKRRKRDGMTNVGVIYKTADEAKAGPPKDKDTNVTPVQWRVFVIPPKNPAENQTPRGFVWATTKVQAAGYYAMSVGITPDLLERRTRQKGPVSVNSQMASLARKLHKEGQFSRLDALLAIMDDANRLRQELGYTGNGQSV